MATRWRAGAAASEFDRSNQCEVVLLLLDIKALFTRAMQTRRGKAGLGVAALVAITIIAYLRPVVVANLRTVAPSGSLPDRQEAELKNGWVTNCAGPEFSRFPSGPGTGPGPDRPVFKISNRLVLAVPKQNWPSTIKFETPPKECRKLDDLPTAPFLYFVISGEWSSGYKPQAIPKIGGNTQFQPDVVTVRIEPEIPDTRSEEEKEKIKRTLSAAMNDLYSGTRAVGNLTCYTPKSPNPFFDCSGIRAAGDSDIVKLRYRDYASTPFLLVQAQYTSMRYGGIVVTWQAWILDASRSLDIDAAVWKSIESWNLESTAQPAQHIE